MVSSNVPVEVPVFPLDVLRDAIFTIILNNAVFYFAVPETVEKDIQTPSAFNRK